MRKYQNTTEFKTQEGVKGWSQLNLAYLCASIRIQLSLSPKKESRDFHGSKLSVFMGKYQNTTESKPQKGVKGLSRI